MAKKRTVYLCSECGYEASGWLGKCPACGSWNTFSEFQVAKQNSAQNRSWLDIPASEGKTVEDNELFDLSEVTRETQTRLISGISELDRVLGGGFVKGSLVLLGGDPGIGKSTLLLQVIGHLNQKHKTLYISGEESPSQIKMHADRVRQGAESIRVFTGTSFEAVKNVLLREKPEFAVIDSIQTIYIEELSSAPGSVSQVRESTSGLLRLAKSLNITIVLVGHVTKEGGIAGPRVLEHMVDTVLYFESEKANQYRILRAVKNRFGTTNEIGIFEMTGEGLKSLANASTALLTGRPLNVPGIAVTACLEGTRSILVEVQALLHPSDYNQPIRNTQGVDRLRLTMLLAILSRNCNIQTGVYDAYVNITGGMKINDTSADLAIVSAIVSSIQNKAIDPELIILGELGLAGEVRMVHGIEKRVQESLRLGWRKFILPATCEKYLKKLKLPENCQLLYVSLLQEVLDILI